MEADEGDRVNNPNEVVELTLNVQTVEQTPIKMASAGVTAAYINANLAARSSTSVLERRSGT